MWLFKLTSLSIGGPFIARDTLHILRNLSFISTRIGQNSSQYTFVNLAAVDILSQYPQISEQFLETIKPVENGEIPAHPVERCLDLFFLNTAEHFTLVLTPEVNERLLISAAIPYLASGGNNNLMEIFEAAHSVVLSVLAAPRSADMAAKHLPFYIDTLFNVRIHRFPFHIQQLLLQTANSMLLGLPPKSLCPPIPTRLPNNFQNHRPSIASGKQSASPPRHPPPAAPRPRLNCRNNTATTSHHQQPFILRQPTTLRTSHPHSHNNRLSLLPTH